ncbi:hypothetical protein EI94DRAFT_1023549 [Lactarius quietus]|nr:hypothetical protein EI94DRAFT_1023549 [Lactarius quietus]
MMLRKRPVIHAMWRRTCDAGQLMPGGLRDGARHKQSSALSAGPWELTTMPAIASSARLSGGVGTHADVYESHTENHPYLRERHIKHRRQHKCAFLDSVMERYPARRVGNRHRAPRRAKGQRVNVCAAGVSGSTAKKTRLQTQTPSGLKKQREKRAHRMRARVAHQCILSSVWRTGASKSPIADTNAASASPDNRNG